MLSMETQHLLIVEGTRLAGIVELTDLSRALLGSTRTSRS
jgi:hypothetical protein